MILRTVTGNGVYRGNVGHRYVDALLRSENGLPFSCRGDEQAGFSSAPAGPFVTEMRFLSPTAVFLWFCLPRGFGT